MRPEVLYELLTEVEKGDPLDFTGLPFEPDDLRRLACLNVAEILQHWQGESTEECELIMAATMVRLVLENLVLHARLAILARGDE